MCKKWLKSIVSALVLGFCLVSVAQAVEPVAHWTFDELEVVDANDPNDPNATIVIVPDSSDNGYDGVLTGEYALVDGVIGGALNFNALGVINVPVEAWNDNILEGYTVSFWAFTEVDHKNVPMAAQYLVDGTQRRNFGCHTPHKNGWVYFDTRRVPESGYPYQRILAGPVREAAYGKWVFWTFVYEPNRQEIWLDGELGIGVYGYLTGDGTAPVAQDTTEFSIGANADGSWGFIGSMDDVRLYDVALAGEEIQAVFENSI
ncbi:LamG-like jellyroll fold domain-containing protein [Planctomycetota bacterium]